MSADRLAKVVGPDGVPVWVVLDSTDSYGLLPAGTSLGSLLAVDAAELAAAVSSVPVTSVGALTFLAPVDDDTEVWAAGVTYEVSRSARMAESTSAGIYAEVYSAQRPELFFKAVGWRVSGPGVPISVRADSTWDVPEPELALICNASGAVVGYTVANDVSSRSIEGENPLYLPQAKIFRGCCGLGPWIRLAVDDPYQLDITVRILRGGRVLWAGSTSTGRLHRSLDELVGYLYQGVDFPRGVVLATGTSAVPGDDVTLLAGDEVVIDIGGVGTLSNPVV